MATYEIQPAYGRDYKTGKEAKDAFASGKDFIGDYQMGFRYMSCRDLKPGDTALVRYRRNTQVVAVKVTAAMVNGTYGKTAGPVDPPIHRTA
jgi:hypothetical protein